MKQWFCLSILFVCACIVNAQVHLPYYPDSLFPTYYQQRATHFKSLPQTKGDVIFLGNSITDGGEWGELFNDLKIKNRGISGDFSPGVLHRLDEITQRKPAKVFLLIGVNDLSRNISPDSVVKNILLIASYLLQETPSTKLLVQSILPVNNFFGKFPTHTNKNELIIEVNKRLKQGASANHYAFIDLHSSFKDQSGKLDPALTNDGLHLLGKGYLLWKHLIYPYLYDLQKEVSLLPLPQKYTRKTGFFFLNDCYSIRFNNDAIREEAIQLQKELESNGLNIPLHNKVQPLDGKALILQLGKVISPQLNEEAYDLNVSSKEIVLTANGRKGIYNGIQTLLQLARDGAVIDACALTDWPAFAWRGYMIDVGRNYVSVDLLKKQIDVMARYKFNVFHFHATEDIAWRLESKLYPQLTAAANMMRDKGSYYTVEEIKELIAYCQMRHISFVPEIDIPGHSAAFKRAMNTDMQSDSGLVIVKKLLREFFGTYDLPYLHIGADEVKLTNKQFLPEITAYVESFGKRVIGWQPGGNFTTSTIRQLWMDDNGLTTGNSNLQYLDSRHLYLNHFDPLESVVSIFNRQLCDRSSGSDHALGATLCLWNDRAVTEENDLLRMNPVYPAMLAFAERSWRGGGQKGWVANISDGDVAAFTEFENRLLDHKSGYFQNKPFPYVQQSGIEWQLFGPYLNGGDVAKRFPPETNRQQVVKKVIGGTVVLRHWWAPLIKGAIENPQDSTTWYAETKIWSNETAERSFWIGFNNLSRSTATDSPPLNNWDEKGSRVWVNGVLVLPPRRKHGGQKGDAEMPLIDEGYEYREPTKIALQKGWNRILIKAPVKSLKGRNWQNPVKWMFSFVPVND